MSELELLQKENELLKSQLKEKDEQISSVQQEFLKVSNANKEVLENHNSIEKELNDIKNRVQIYESILPMTISKETNTSNKDLNTNLDSLFDE